MEKKKGITIIAGNETYENLATFKTVDELNETVRAYKEKFVDQLNKTQLAVLNKLHNYSSKYFGVSFRAKKNIAEDLNISRRTVIRVCLHLESLGIIKQLEMKRNSDMRQTSNAIVIQPIIVEEQVVTQAPIKNEEKCHTNKTKPISLKQKTKDINIRNSNESQSNVNDNDFIDYRVPQSMRMKLATAFGSKVINESFHNAVNIVKKAAKKFSLVSDKDVFNNILANASVALFSKTHEVEHNGTLMKNPIGYFTNTFKTMVYNYIDSFRDIHNISKRKENNYVGLAMFEQFIEG
ncbi:MULTISPECIES: helix-turn-helix domain-containing protein [Bacillus cereus group]|uniref:helix-turn-helix domain-containing protein n=1 Tax=Bacillus cereus group TaxID=86661 RepID=UPI0018CD8231|nr:MULTISPECIES: helix-turn-helix domain-containing protein [Bacillus cereus group]MBG9839094.1 cytosolic protein [Bacillus tropicus]MBG9876625.1 cytosolic protein [Bacillus tropicus]MBG9919667.1 cytosolic protein [Bacillus tropicus]MBJ8354810.1 cytosolic protein [Bacillus mycoides]MED2902018.1 helix-turn-helix domain-containing protein [Bacillus tropicus]